MSHVFNGTLPRLMVLLFQAKLTPRIFLSPPRIVSPTPSLVRGIVWTLIALVTLWFTILHRLALFLLFLARISRPILWLPWGAQMTLSCPWMLLLVMAMSRTLMMGVLAPL